MTPPDFTQPVSGPAYGRFFRLLATAMAYLKFAATHRSLFALFFLEQPSTRRSLDEAPPPDSPYGLLLERVAHFVGRDGADVETLAFGVWSLVHGAAVLRQTHLRDFSGPVVEATRLNLERLLDGWATATDRPPRSPQ